MKEIRHTRIRAVAKDPPEVRDRASLTRSMRIICFFVSIVLRPEYRTRILTMFVALLGMVGVYAQEGKEKLFSAWMAAPPVWLEGHKNSVNVVQGLRVVCFQNPALLADVVLVEDAQVEDLLL